MKKGINRILIAGVVLVVNLLFAACGAKHDKASQKEEKVIFRYGYTATNSNVLSGLDGIAEEQGYFKEELGKENAEFKAVPFVKAGPAINSALASGELDSGTLGDVPAIVAKSQGAETTAVDIQDSDYSTHLVVSKNSGVKQVKDLKGKKVAVQTGSYMQRILFQILEKNGLSSKDVQLVNMSEVDAANAIEAGSIDATAVTEMKGYKLEQGKNVEVLYDTKGDQDLARTSATLVSNKFAKEHPEVVTAYFRALIRAQKYAKKHPEDLRKLYIKSGLEEKIVDLTYPKLTDYKSITGTTEENKKVFEEVITFLKDNKLIKKSIDLNTWFDGSFYENAKKEVK